MLTAALADGTGPAVRPSRRTRWSWPTTGRRTAAERALVLGAEPDEHAPATPWRSKAQAERYASAQLARAVHAWVGVAAGQLEGLLWGHEDAGPAAVAEHLRGEVEDFVSVYGARVRPLTSSGMPLRVPADFVARLTADVRRMADTGGGPGTWVESATTRPRVRRGRPRREVPYSRPAYEWSARREKLFAEIVAHALALCGLGGADLNRMLGPVRKAEADEMARSLATYRAAHKPGKRAKSPA